MILYRKAAQLRVRRSTAPEAPFWAATTIAPYAPRRATPVAIDYLSLHATGAERLEVTVADHVRDELERTRALAAPVLVDATGRSEVVFRRGEEALAFCEEQQYATVHLTSTDGALPQRAYADSVSIVSAWPADAARLDAIGAEAAALQLTWGVAVPVIFPVTTDLPLLAGVADVAQRHGAAFLAALGIDVEPTARQSIAQSMGLTADDDRYAMLFHSALEPLHLATERHIAALAAERGLADTIVLPRGDERSNWNAAVLLTRTASRMIAMELDLDLAGTVARSARTIAELDKPIDRVAAAASLSIIGGVDETSVEMLEQWMSGEPVSFAEYVDEQWRMRRA